MSTPQSTIVISHVDGLDNRYKNTRHWDSLLQQNEYITQTCRKAIFEDYTYLRRSWSIKVNATMEKADGDGWNYLSFRNQDSGKWFYYFINNYEYINDNCIELFLEMDVMQTYFFDMELLHSFVEREHPASDKIGANTVPENLECGDLEILLEKEINFDLCILILASFNPETSSALNRVNAFGFCYDDVFSGLGLFAVAQDDWYQMETKLDKFDEWGYTDGIISMWMYPKELVNLWEGDEWTVEGVLFRSVAGIRTGIEKTVDISSVYIDYDAEFLPKKMYSAPFLNIYVTNNVGQSAVYDPACFGSGAPQTINFELFGCLSAEGSLKIAPCNYKSLSAAYDEGIYAGNFPTCSWDADVYKLWFAQNRNTVQFAEDVGKFKIASGVFNAGLGLLPFINAGSFEGGISQAVNGYEQIKQQQAQLKDMQVQPPQSKGNYSASVNVANKRNGFTVQVKAPRAEYRQRIKQFFDLYGYTVNSVKVPTTNNRKHYTFVKTLDCNVGGNVPHDCAVKIAAIMDTGITFWRPSVNVGDYSVADVNTPNS